MPPSPAPSLERLPSIHPGDISDTEQGAQGDTKTSRDAGLEKAKLFFRNVKSFGGATLSTIGKTLDKCVELALTGIQKAHNYIGSKITKDNAGAAFVAGLALSVGGIAGMALGGPAGVVLGIGSLCVGLSMMHHAGMTNERYASLFTPTSASSCADGFGSEFSFSSRASSEVHNPEVSSSSRASSEDCDTGGEWDDEEAKIPMEWPTPRDPVSYYSDK